jgi:hypothetical protein
MQARADSTDGGNDAQIGLDIRPFVDRSTFGLHRRHRGGELAGRQAFEVPADASDEVVIGEGAVLLDTTDGEADADSRWVDSIDIDQDGTMNETQLMWDDEDGILYAFAHEVFDCLDGEGTADGGMLVGIFGEENVLGAPVGSGFYIVGLDAGECDARTAMLWGCKFDETGVETKCGEATLDAAAGTVEITTIEPME